MSAPLHAHGLLCRVTVSSAPTIAGFQACKRVLRCLAGLANATCAACAAPAWSFVRLAEWRPPCLAHGVGCELRRRPTRPTWPGRTRWRTRRASSDHCRQQKDAPHLRFHRPVPVRVRLRRECLQGSRVPSQLDALLPAQGRPHGPQRRRLRHGNTRWFTNATMVADTSSKQHWHDVNEKHVAECVERKMIAVHHKPGSLPWDPRPGDGFRPDAMTKALSRPLTEFYCDEIHGRRPLPPGTRAAVDGNALCTVVSPVHSRCNIFCGMVGVRHYNGTSCTPTAAPTAFLQTVSSSAGGKSNRTLRQIKLSHNLDA